jgi:hypothetical protein
MLRTVIFTVCVVLAVQAAAAENPAELDKALERIEAAKTPAEAALAMRPILARAQEAPAMHLFIASAVALQTKALEDAAYLFYAAQMRTRYDLTRFPPKGTGADSPGVALGAMSQQLGAEINPAVMREPATFAKVVTRVQAWKPSVPSGYSPGWEYTAVREADAQRQFTEHREGFTRQMGGLSTLLNDSEYFRAFKVLQDYNFSPYDEQQKPARLSEKKSAEAKMLEIETARGIEGIFYRKDR